MATIFKYPPVRSPRFPVDVPLEVRSGDETQWWPARTENVSATGVLFRSANAIPPRTPIELKFQLGVGDGAVILTCSGTVARVADKKAAGGEAYVAASLNDFGLVHVPAGAPPASQAGGDVATLIHRLNTLLFIISGNAEIVSIPTASDALHKTASAHITNAVDEAAAIVRTLATKLKQQQT